VSSTTVRVVAPAPVVVNVSANFLAPPTGSRLHQIGDVLGDAVAARMSSPPGRSAVG
jgi:hypothetical protein